MIRLLESMMKKHNKLRISFKVFNLFKIHIIIEYTLLNIKMIKL